MRIIYILFCWFIFGLSKHSMILLLGPAPITESSYAFLQYWLAILITTVMVLSRKISFLIPARLTIELLMIHK